MHFRVLAQGRIPVYLFISLHLPLLNILGYAVVLNEWQPYLTIISYAPVTNDHDTGPRLFSTALWYSRNSMPATALVSAMGLSCTLAVLCTSL